MSTVPYTVHFFVRHHPGDATGTGASVDLLAGSPARARSEGLRLARERYPDAAAIEITRVVRHGDLG